MIGVDPSPAMLESGPGKGPDADGVRWVQGDAGRLGAAGADLAIMSGHVAQFILADAEWLEALAGVKEALRLGGILGLRDPRPASARVGTLDRPQAHHPGFPLTGGSSPGPR